MGVDLWTGLAGAALCMFGFVLYMGGLRMLGLFIGGSIGCLIGIIVAYVGNMDRTLTLIVVLVAILIGAALGWRFIKTLHRILVFLVGAGAGYLIGEFVLPSFGPAWDAAWVSLVCTVVGGVVFVLLFRYIIILVTAAVGSYLLYQATDQRGWVMPLAFAIGVVIQIGAFRGLRLDRRVQLKRS